MTPLESVVERIVQVSLPLFQVKQPVFPELIETAVQWDDDLSKVDPELLKQAYAPAIAQITK